MLAKISEKWSAKVPKPGQIIFQHLPPPMGLQSLVQNTVAYLGFVRMPKRARLRVERGCARRRVASAWMIFKTNS